MINATQEDTVSTYETAVAAAQDRRDALIAAARTRRPAALGMPAYIADAGYPEVEAAVDAARAAYQAEQVAIQAAHPGRDLTPGLIDPRA